MAFRITFEGVTDSFEPGAEMRVVGVLAIAPVIEKPAATTGLRLTALAADEVSIAWDEVAGATGYKVYRGVTLVGDVGVLTLTDDTVTASTAYIYTVVPYNSAGSSEMTPEALAVDVPADEPDVPDAPTLSLVAVTARSAEFQWSQILNATGYKVYDGETLLDSVTGVGYLHSSLTPESEHSYTVVAFNDAGDGDPSDALEVTTDANSAPVWDLDDQSGTVGQFFSLNLALFVLDLDGDDLTITLVENGVPGLALAGTVYSGSPTTSGSYSPTFRVSDGIDTSDVTINFSVAAAADTTGPTAPVISATANGSTISVDVVTQSTDTSGVKNYQIHRSTDGVNFALRITRNLEELPFADTGLSDGTYYYKSRARDLSPAQNVGPFSDPVSATVSTTPLQPDAPISFNGVVASGSRINLSWAAGPSGPAPTSYELQHSTSSGGPWETISSALVTSFAHTGISTTVNNFYRIRAAAGGQFSGYVTLTVAGSGAAAQFIIAANATVFDGSNAAPVGGGANRAVQPGEIVEFAARSNGTGGAKQALIIRNLRGSTNNRIILRAPSSGQAIIRRAANGSGNHVFRMENCQDVDCRFLSTSSSVPLSADGKRHGVKVMYADVGSGKDNPSQWFKYQVGSGSGYRGCRNISLDGLEVDGGWPSRSNVGIGIGSNDHSAKAADYPGVWQENLQFSNLYVHDIASEGMYIGANPDLSFNGNPTEGEGRDIPIRNAEICDSWFVDIAGEGINPKSWFDGNNSIHDNVIIRASTDSENGKGAINTNSVMADIYNNYIEDTGGPISMSLNITAGTNIDFPGTNTEFVMRVFNNVIRKTAGSPAAGKGIQVLKVSKAGQSLPDSWRLRVRVFNNTIVNLNGTEIDMSNSHPTSYARNNLLPGGNIDYAETTNNGSNITSGTPANTFVNPSGSMIGGNPDFHLLAPKPASGTVGTGDPSSWGSGVSIAGFDIEGTQRLSGSADVGAYEFQ